MNAPEKPTLSLRSASEYILDNFKPTDRVAILVLNRQLGETTQRITTAQKASSPEFQAWLRYKNANGADIYVGMNALQHHASTRTKDDIEKISGHRPQMVETPSANRPSIRLVTLGNGQVPADVIVGSDGRPHAIRVVSSNMGER